MNLVDWVSGHKRGNHDLGLDAGGLNIAEHGGLSAKPIEGGKVEVGQPVFVQLAVGKFVQNDPEDTSVRCHADWAGEGFGYCLVVEMPRLNGEKCGLDQGKGAHNARGHENHHPELLNLSEGVIDHF